MYIPRFMVDIDLSTHHNSGATCGKGRDKTRELSLSIMKSLRRLHQMSDRHDEKNFYYQRVYAFYETFA